MRDFFSAVSFRFSAQYFFIRLLTAFFWAADIFLPPRPFSAAFFEAFRSRDLVFKAISLDTRS